MSSSIHMFQGYEFSLFRAFSILIFHLLWKEECLIIYCISCRRPHHPSCEPSRSFTLCWISDAFQILVWYSFAEANSSILMYWYLTGGDGPNTSLYKNGWWSSALKTFYKSVTWVAAVASKEMDGGDDGGDTILLHLLCFAGMIQTFMWHLFPSIACWLLACSEDKLLSKSLLLLLGNLTSQWVRKPRIQ